MNANQPIRGQKSMYKLYNNYLFYDVSNQNQQNLVYPFSSQHVWYKPSLNSNLPYSKHMFQDVSLHVLHIYEFPLEPQCTTCTT